MTTKKIFMEYDEEFIEHFRQVVEQEARLMEVAADAARVIGYEEERANHAAAYSLATKALAKMPGIIFYVPLEDASEHIHNWPLFRQTIGFTAQATTRGEIEAFIEQVVLFSADSKDGPIDNDDLFLTMIRAGEKPALPNLDLMIVQNYTSLAKALIRFYYEDEANYLLQLEKAYTSKQWAILNK